MQLARKESNTEVTWMSLWRMGLGDRIFWAIDISIFVGLLWLKYGMPLFGLTWGLAIMLATGALIVGSRQIYVRTHRR